MPHPQDKHGLLTLACGNARLLLAPAIGGSIAAYDEQTATGLVNWLRPASSAALNNGDVLGMASFPLIPFCNRIRDGRFTLEREVALAPNYLSSPHTLHGNAWRNPWQVENADATSAQLIYTHAADEWPYTFVARQSYQLSARTLRVSMTVTNTSDCPMPLGIGHHPYFPYEPGTTIAAKVDGIWCSDAEIMPTHIDTAHPVLAALRGGNAVNQFELDNNFTGWDRHALITWPQSARTLTLRAVAPLDFLVLVTSAKQDFFCLEAVSNCTDWLNLRERYPQEVLGGTMLAPGQELSTSFELITALTM